MKKKVLVGSLVGLAILCCGGLFVCKKYVKNYNKDVKECTVNANNGREISYDGVMYTVTKDEVDEKEINKKVGCVRKIIGLDEDYKVVLQSSLSDLKNIDKLKDVKEKLKFQVSYGNVYEASKDRLIIEVDDKEYKLVKTDDLKDKADVIELKQVIKHDEKTITGKFKVNKNNATQIICDGRTYQIEETNVSEDKLGRLITTMTDDVVYDDDTKKVIPMKELRNSFEIIPGEKSNQKRVQKVFGNVYAIGDKEEGKEIAVTINNDVFRAVRIK